MGKRLRFQNLFGAFAVEVKGPGAPTTTTCVEDRKRTFHSPKSARKRPSRVEGEAKPPSWAMAAVGCRETPSPCVGPLPVLGCKQFRYGVNFVQRS